MEYVNNKELHMEIIYCQERGQYSNKLYKMFKLMIDKISYKFNYKWEEWRQDCKAYAHEQMYRTYRNYNPDKTNNPFAYFTQVIKAAFVFQYNRLIQRSDTGLYQLKTINFSELFTDQRNGSDYIL